MLAISAIAIAVFSFVNSPKIGFVRSQVLISEFSGMKKANQKVEIESLRFTARLDTLKMEYQETLNLISLHRSEGKPIDSLLMEAQRRENNIQNYSIAAENALAEIENKYLEGAINQMNAYIETYGKKNNYEVILGSTLSGSILYGGEALDITEEVLDSMNSEYNE